MRRRRGHRDVGVAPVPAHRGGGRPKRDQPGSDATIFARERGVRIGPESRANVVLHVLRTARAGDHAGHRRMGEHEFEQHLRPGLATDVGGPRGQRLAEHRSQQAAPAEGPVDDHRDAAILRQREQPLLGRAVVERVVELDEIQRLGAHHRLELGIGAGRVVRDAEVADAALFLPGAQRRELRLPVDQVVDLHQVDAVGAKELDRPFHLRDAGFTSARPHLGGDERLVACLHRRQHVADDALRGAVHRRGIDDRAAVGEQDPQHFDQRRPVGGARSDVEGPPRAAADDRQRFAGRRNRARVHPVTHRGVGAQGPRSGARRRRAGDEPQEFVAGHGEGPESVSASGTPGQRSTGRGGPVDGAAPRPPAREQPNAGLGARRRTIATARRRPSGHGRGDQAGGGCVASIESRPPNH